MSPSLRFSDSTKERGFLDRIYWIDRILEKGNQPTWSHLFLAHWREIPSKGKVDNPTFGILDPAQWIIR